MSIHIAYEGKLLLYSILTGAGLMMIYDLFRIFRIFVPHSFLFIGTEDMIFWIYASFAAFSLFYKQNDGGLRGYVIVGIFLGMVLYDRAVSRFFLKLLKKTWKYLKIRICKLFRNNKRS